MQGRAFTQMKTILKTVSFAGLAFAQTACSSPMEPPADVGAIVGYVVVGSRPADVQVQVTSGCRHPFAAPGASDKERCTVAPVQTDGSGKYRFVNLRVGWTYTVEVAANTVPEGVVMHVRSAEVTIPESKIAWANFYGSWIEPKP